MIFMPPRHGKSLTATEKNAAWFLGRYPDKRVVIASYAQDLALGWSRRARDLLQQQGPEIFGAGVRTDSKSAGMWETTHGGSLKAIGVGSGITGQGADLFIIDDPLKDNEQAQSEVIREKQWDWWQTTARTRLMPGGGVILIMTRWHEDDLAGRLLKQMADGDGDQWEVISMPALAEATCSATYEGGKLDLGPDPLGRQEGEALWPVMFNEQNLAQTRKATDSYWFAGMYQQRPAPDEGGIFKRRDYRYWRGWQAVQQAGPEGVFRAFTDRGEVDVDLTYCAIFQTVDTAASDDEKADYTVVSTWAVDHAGRLYLLDRYRDRIEVDEQPGVIISEYARWQPMWVGLEVVAANAAKGVYRELLKARLPMRKLVADKDKRTRAIPASMRLQEHQVYWPADAPWRDEWESELGAFPNSAHDDQVDTFAYAGRALPEISVAPQPKKDANQQLTRPLTAAAGAGAGIGDV